MTGPGADNFTDKDKKKNTKYHQEKIKCTYHTTGKPKQSKHMITQLTVTHKQSGEPIWETNSMKHDFAVAPYINYPVTENRIRVKIPQKLPTPCRS